MKKLLRWIELIALFGLVPVGLYYINVTPAGELPIDFGKMEPRRMIFPLLWLVAIAAMIAWKRKYSGHKIFKHFTRDLWKPLLKRFAACALFMVAFLVWYDPSRVLSLPLQRPDIWVMVMVLYPLVSVVPQEVIYRLFFFERYAILFPKTHHMILASGIAFGHGHLLFNNWVAYALSIAGGIIFASTYARTRNMLYVCAEHAIYGQYVFTIGLGWYFYSGAAQMHQ